MPKDNKEKSIAREGYINPGTKNVEKAVNRLTSPSSIFSEAIKRAKKNAKERLGYK